MLCSFEYESRTVDNLGKPSPQFIPPIIAFFFVFFSVLRFEPFVPAFRFGSWLGFFSRRDFGVFLGSVARRRCASVLCMQARQEEYRWRVGGCLTEGGRVG